MGPTQRKGTTMTTIPAKGEKLIQQWEKSSSMRAMRALTKYLNSGQLTLTERVLISRRIREGK
jgi:hypothetical protein